MLITGSGSGLGAAVATQASKHGWSTIGVDVRPSPSADEYRVADVSDFSSLHEALREIESIDAVVTCAGIDHPGALASVRHDAWDNIIKVNLIGTANVARWALSRFPNSGGHIMTVASTLGLRAVGEATAYCASKFGVVGFTRALSVELGSQHAVTLVIPGGMRTSFFDHREERFKPGPEAQLADPKDIAEMMIAALNQPSSGAIREMIITPPGETSWP